MNNILLTITGLFTCCLLFGQSEKLDRRWYDNNYLREVQKIEFSVGVDTAASRFTITQIDKETSRLNFYTTISDITLPDADLTFNSLRKKQVGIKSKIEVLGIRRKTEEGLQLIAEGDCDCPKDYLKKGDSQFVLYDVTESFLEPSQSYVLELQHDFSTDFDPEIILEPISPNWYGVPLMLSAGGLIIANTFRNDSQEAKETYNRIWRDGEIGGDGTNESQFYQIYNNKRKLAINTTIGAIAIPSGLALFIYLKSKGRKERMELQKKLHESLSWQVYPVMKDNAVGLTAVRIF